MMTWGVEILIVDNASSDGTESLLLLKKTNVRYLRLKKNTGFAGACNYGAEHARGEFLLFLNNDCDIDASNILILLNFLDEYPDIIATQPVVQNILGDVENIGSLINLKNMKGELLTDKKRVSRAMKNQNDTPIFTSDSFYSLVGTCLLIRTHIFRKLGMFDSFFHSYHEDIDFFMRAKKIRMDFAPCLGAQCTHSHRATSSKMGCYKEKRDLFNLTLLIKKHYPIHYIAKNFFSLSFERMKNVSGLLKCIVRKIFARRDRITKLITIAILFSIFALLAYRDIFSERTLVPNLEPYPDTLYYSIPAWNFAHGSGFAMTDGDYSSKIVTPPLYSLYLMPFFAIFRDIRIFYVANTLLSVASLGLFLLILRRQFHSKLSVLAIFVLGFFYISNFYVYTLPSLLMAENITLFLILCSLFLMTARYTVSHSALLAVSAISLVFVKFSNIPYSVAILLLHSIAVFRTRSKKIILSFITASGILGVIFIGYYIEFHSDLRNPQASSFQAFSPQYFTENVILYVRSLFGGSSRYLWWDYRLIHPLLGFLSAVGILVGFLRKELRKTTLYCCVIAVSAIGFMSFFYYFDTRYILALYPLVLICVGITFVVLEKFPRILNIGLILVFFAMYVFTSGNVYQESVLVALKKQVGLNIRHAEGPWNYVAVKNWNEYFQQSSIRDPIIATFLPPYYTKYYFNNTVTHLPIVPDQAFAADRIDAGTMNKIGLREYYSQKLKSGKSIYISPYYSSNVKHWPVAYQGLIQHFKPVLVQEGCFGACNLYRLDGPSQEE